MAHTDPDVDERRLPQPTRLLGELAQMLALGPRALSPGECELVAEYVAGPSECEFCCDPHSVFNATWLAADDLPVSPMPGAMPGSLPHAPLAVHAPHTVNTARTAYSAHTLNTVAPNPTESVAESEYAS